MNDRRPPNWGAVWMQARRAHRDPVAALAEAGLIDPIDPIRTDPPGPPAAGPHARRRDGPAPAAELVDGQAAGEVGPGRSD